ncbi:MAG: OmpA family protein [Candidatus Omnitrophota bacterium]|jgi:hypothetical protein
MKSKQMFRLGIVFLSAGSLAVLAGCTTNNYSSISGPRGPTGPSGYAGQQGLTGPKGVSGVALMGERGPAGSDGYAGSAGSQGIVGKTGSQGTTTAGVAGSTGYSGVQGSVGKKGATGERGVVGKVAYCDLYKEFVFSYDDTSLNAEDMQKVKEIAAYMKANRSLQVGIDGTAVSSRDQRVNNLRINAIREALINAGVSSDKIWRGAIGDSKLRRKGRIAVFFTSI